MLEISFGRKHVIFCFADAEDDADELHERNNTTTILK